LAQSAWIARHTEGEALAGRNSALAAGNAVTEAASFGLTGWLFQLAGASVAIVTDALTYLASALLLAGVEERAPPARAATGGGPQAVLAAFVDDVNAGLRSVAAEPTLRAVAVIAALTSFGSSFAATTYMIYVSRDLAFPTGTLGLIFALGGFGSLAGAWAVARLSHRVAAPRLLVAGLALWALGAAAAPLAGSATLVGALLLCTQQLVGDAGAIAYHITDRTLRQSRAPEAQLARVDASIRALGQGFTLAGALLAGALAEAFGARAVLFGASALVAVATLVAWRMLRAPSAAAARDAAG
jgi:Na+/melibiose symporter-like transporter